MRLKVDNISSGYGKSTIIKNLSFETEEGEVLALIGRNGMGKTTLMRTIIGLIKASEGNIFFEDRDITNWRASRRARIGIGYVPQGNTIFGKLTVRENLVMGESISCNIREELHYDLVFEKFPILKERINQKAGTLSGGERQMLSIGRALIGKPSLLLLDEPSEGIQPSIVKQIGEDIISLNKTLGLSIIIAEQNYKLIENIADRCCVLKKGIICDYFTRNEFANTSKLKDALLI